MVSKYYTFDEDSAKAFAKEIKKKSAPDLTGYATQEDVARLPAGSAAAFYEDNGSSPFIALPINTLSSLKELTLDEGFPQARSEHEKIVQYLASSMKVNATVRLSNGADVSILQYCLDVKAQPSNNIPHCRIVGDTIAVQTALNMPEAERDYAKFILAVNANEHHTTSGLFAPMDGIADFTNGERCKFGVTADGTWYYTRLNTEIKEAFIFAPSASKFQENPGMLIRTLHTTDSSFADYATFLTPTPHGCGLSTYNYLEVEYTLNDPFGENMCVRGKTRIDFPQNNRSDSWLDDAYSLFNETFGGSRPFDEVTNRDKVYLDMSTLANTGFKHTVSGHISVTDGTSSHTTNVNQFYEYAGRILLTLNSSSPNWPRVEIRLLGGVLHLFKIDDSQGASELRPTYGSPVVQPPIRIDNIYGVKKFPDWHLTVKTDKQYFFQFHDAELGRIPLYMGTPFEDLLYIDRTDGTDDELEISMAKDGKAIPMGSRWQASQKDKGCLDVQIESCTGNYELTITEKAQSTT